MYKYLPFILNRYSLTCYHFRIGHEFVTCWRLFMCALWFWEWFWGHYVISFVNECIVYFSTGSPFYASILDGSKASASGDGLRSVPAGRPALFDVHTQGVGGDASCNVTVISPTGHSVPARVTGSPNTGYRVEYSPSEIGQCLLQKCW